METITLNGTEVKVEEVNGKNIVTITTEDADVIVNDQCLWSKYDKPEYQDVPAVLRSFIHGKNDFLETKDGIVTTDLWMKGSNTCATFYIPQNKRKAITARLDLVTSLQDLEYEYLRNNTNIHEKTADALLEEFKALFADIKETVESAGYKLAYSHDMREFIYGWWDVIFPLSKWNEETFVTIWKKFSNFNARLNQVVDQYGK